jgi:predicted rRNA methylase YqxC with S4 and FtsJ domains
MQVVNTEKRELTITRTQKAVNSDKLRITGQVKVKLALEFADGTLVSRSGLKLDAVLERFNGTRAQNVREALRNLSLM